MKSSPHEPIPYLPSLWQRLLEGGPVVLALHILVVASFAGVLVLSLLSARRKSPWIVPSFLSALSFSPLLLSTFGAWYQFRYTRLTLDVELSDPLTRYGLGEIMYALDSAFFFLRSGWIFTAASLICVYLFNKFKVA